jgi:hypothetical protein
MQMTAAVLFMFAPKSGTMRPSRSFRRLPLIDVQGSGSERIGGPLKGCKGKMAPTGQTRLDLRQQLPEESVGNEQQPFLH